MKTLPMKHGDIYAVGNHLIAYGDSRDPDLVKRLLGTDRVALIIADVPYGVALVEGKAGFMHGKSKHIPIANDHLQSDEEFAHFTNAWLQAVKPFLQRKNAAYIFSSDKMLFALRNGMVNAGWKFAQLLFWLKTAAVIGRLDYAPQHECICYGYFGVHAFMKSKDKSVIIHPKPQKNRFHPSEKPIPILRRLILNSSRIGDIVYDPFAGSGTTGIAAEQTKRRSVMIELEPAYCRIIIARLEKLTGALSKKIPSRIHA